jgi:hypothetical protein
MFAKLKNLLGLTNSIENNTIKINNLENMLVPTNDTETEINDYTFDLLNHFTNNNDIDGGGFTDIAEGAAAVALGPELAVGSLAEGMIGTKIAGALGSRAARYGGRSLRGRLMRARPDQRRKYHRIIKQHHRNRGQYHNRKRQYHQGRRQHHNKMHKHHERKYDRYNKSGDQKQANIHRKQMEEHRAEEEHHRNLHDYHDRAYNLHTEAEQHHREAEENSNDDEKYYRLNHRAHLSSLHAHKADLEEDPDADPRNIEDINHIIKTYNFNFN